MEHANRAFYFDLNIESQQWREERSSPRRSARRWKNASHFQPDMNVLRVHQHACRAGQFWCKFSRVFYMLSKVRVLQGSKRQI